MLTDEQQDGLVTVSFDVDLTKSGISDESLTAGLITQPDLLRNHIDAMAVNGMISPEAGDSLMNYIFNNEMLVAKLDPTGAVVGQQYDADKLGGLLGITPIVAGQTDPAPETRDAAQAMMAGFSATDGFRPDSLEGLDFWLDINGYPHLEDVDLSAATAPPGGLGAIVADPSAPLPATTLVDNFSNTGLGLPANGAAQSGSYSPVLATDPILNQLEGVQNSSPGGFDASLIGIAPPGPPVDPAVLFPDPRKP